MIRSNVRNLLTGLTLREVLQFRAVRPDIVEYVDEWLWEICAEFEGEPCLTGIMVGTIELYGTDITIPKGCRVTVTAATDLTAGPLMWYVTPRDGWHTIEDRYVSSDISILVNIDDLTDLEDYDGRDLPS